jgi:Fe2+ or Zn2+ uptake regulation protein
MPRPSPIRDQVWDLLSSGSRHAWSFEELLDEIRAQTPSANYSSVFRAMTFFEEQGRVRRVDVGDGKSRYEPTSRHHDHVHCQSCGRVAEIAGGCLVDEVERRVGNVTGFAVSSHTLVFNGTCPDCLAGVRLPASPV